METIVKTQTSKPLTMRKGVRFRSMLTYIHSYFRFVCSMQTEVNGLSPDDYFRVVRTKSPGSDTHIFTGEKYTIQITIRMNQPEKGGAK